MNERLNMNQNCTGCGACLQACPADCIKMIEKELGALYPYIEEEKCINCGVCDKVCALNQNIKVASNQKAYAVIHKDKNILSDSSSGGFFTAIAEWTLAQGGVVYGCAYGEDLSPVTIGVETYEGLNKLRGSKYVQSDTSKVFIEVKKSLDCGREVLFTGTPCQVAGLKAFLKKEYAKLLCVDIVCHGVPSAKYFLDYIHHLEHKTKSKVLAINFRDKRKKGWGLSGSYTGVYWDSNKGYTQNLPYFNSYYYFYFLSGMIYRDSCYTCKYANLDRVGDFTIGDLWGVEGMDISFPTNNGCSLVIVNSEKGEPILEKLNILCQEVSLIDAVKHNKQLSQPTRYPDKRNDRLKEYNDKKPNEIEQIFYKSNSKNILMGKIKYILPKWLKRFLLKIKYKF